MSAERHETTEGPSQYDADARPLDDLVAHENSDEVTGVVAPEEAAPSEPPSQYGAGTPPLDDLVYIQTHESCDEVSGVLVSVEIRSASPASSVKTRVTRVWTLKRTLSVAAQAGAGAAIAIFASHAFWPAWNALSRLWR